MNYVNHELRRAAKRTIARLRLELAWHLSLLDSEIDEDCKILEHDSKPCANGTSAS